MLAEIPIFLTFYGINNMYIAYVYCYTLFPCCVWRNFSAHMHDVSSFAHENSGNTRALRTQNTRKICLLQWFLRRVPTTKICTKCCVRRNIRRLLPHALLLSLTLSFVPRNILAFAGDDATTARSCDPHRRRRGDDDDDKHLACFARSSAVLYMWCIQSLLCIERSITRGIYGTNVYVYISYT